jgi:FlaA1/EpsC-like NDP-sugar epimerase
MDASTSHFEQFVVRLARARVILLFTLHVFVFTACFLLANLVRFEFSLPTGYRATLLATLPVVVGVQLLFGFFFRFYQGWWRYVGINDVIRLVFGVSAASMALGAIWYVGGRMHLGLAFAASSRGALVVDWAFALLTLFGARVLVRIGRDRFRSGVDIPETKKRVLIIGAGDAGETLAREIEHRPHLGLTAVGFVDDQRAKWGSHIRGIAIAGPISSIARIAEQKQAQEVLIAIPNAGGRRMREIVHQLAAAGLPFRTIPGLDQLATGSAQVANLRPVNADDLIRREEIVISDSSVRDLFRGRRVVVTGAGGSIGSELVMQVLKYEPAELHLFERSELALYHCCLRVHRETPDLSALVVPHLVDCADADKLVTKIRPAIVVHAAAHKHVPLGEQNPAEYVRNNCVVARSFAEVCAAADVEHFVFISTDKAINPINAMGASKRAAEIALLELGATSNLRVMVVRFGNVIGSSGSVVPLFLDQIAAGGPVTVTHPDVTRYFLRSSEAISLILQAVAIGRPGGIYMLDMGEPMRIADLARDLIHLSNRSLDEIPIVYTGLRPGEKLEETIRGDSETVIPTQHPHVRMMKVPQPAPATVAAWYRRVKAAAGVESPALGAIIKELIPEYGAATPDTPRSLPPPPRIGEFRPAEGVS